LAKYKLNIT